MRRRIGDEVKVVPRAGSAAECLPRKAPAFPSKCPMVCVFVADPAAPAFGRYCMYCIAGYPEALAEHFGKPTDVLREEGELVFELSQHVTHDVGSHRRSLRDDLQLRLDVGPHRREDKLRIDALDPSDDCQAQRGGFKLTVANDADVPPRLDGPNM